LASLPAPERRGLFFLVALGFALAGAILRNIGFVVLGSSALLAFVLDGLGLVLDFFRLARRMKTLGVPAFGASRVQQNREIEVEWDGKLFLRPIFKWNSLRLRRAYTTPARSGDGFEVFHADGRSRMSPRDFRLRRGVWNSPELAVSLRDPLGLARAEFVFAVIDSFTVPAAVRDFSLETLLGAGGLADSGSQPSRRDDELWDSRKYAPGDDARKVNWKQFGHTGELFIRIGDHLPPPQSQVSLYFDPCLPNGARLPEAIAAMEGLVESAQAICLRFFAEGVSLALESGLASPVFVSASEDDAESGRKGIQRFFASLNLRERDANISAQPLAPNSRRYVFAFPAAQSVNQLVERIAAQGRCQISLIYPRLKRREVSLGSLLFFDAKADGASRGLRALQRRNLSRLRPEARAGARDA
jgi:hypothetical protein